MAPPSYKIYLKRAVVSFLLAIVIPPIKESELSGPDESLQYLENVWSNGTLEEIKEILRSMKITDMPSDDLPNSDFDNIGEIHDPDENGSCKGRYVLNSQGKW